jgi:hypothetical protein
MRLRVVHFALVPVLAFGLTGCGGSEPSEAQMKDAMNDFLNHPPDTTVTDPVTITSFTKGACEKPTGLGYKCTFSMGVTSANPLAQMFTSLPSGTFYKDTNSGKWMMRAPF